MITSKWNEVKKLVPARDQTLGAELTKQQSILLLYDFSFSLIKAILGFRIKLFFSVFGSNYSNVYNTLLNLYSIIDVM